MSRGDAKVPRPLVGGCQEVTVSGTSARTSSGVSAQTRMVLIQSTEAAHYAFGDSSVAATTSDTRINGGTEHLIRINPGQYVAFIQDTTGGTAHVSEFDG